MKCERVRQSVYMSVFISLSLHPSKRAESELVSHSQSKTLICLYVWSCMAVWDTRSLLVSVFICVSPPLSMLYSMLFYIYMWLSTLSCSVTLPVSKLCMYEHNCTCVCITNGLVFVCRCSACLLSPSRPLGATFDRQASIRRSLINTDTVSRRPKKVKRRKTISGLPDNICTELGMVYTQSCSASHSH